MPFWVHRRSLIQGTEPYKVGEPFSFMIHCYNGCQGTSILFGPYRQLVIFFCLLFFSYFWFKIQLVLLGAHEVSLVGHFRQLVVLSRSFWTGLVQLGPGVVEVAAFNSDHTIEKFHCNPSTVTNNLASLVPSLFTNFSVTWRMKNVMWPNAGEEPWNWNKATT